MSIPFDTIASSLLARADSLLPEWFPAGKREGSEYRIGNIRGDAGRSLSINTQTGVWRDFAGDEGGADLISLYAAKNGLSQADAARQLAPHLANGHDRAASPVKTEAAPTIPEAPGSAALYRYTDRFYVARYEREDGSKVFTPLTWDGSTWNKKAPAKPRPLYGLTGLTDRPSAPVMVVEGEKTAQAAALVLKAYVVMTWAGGAQSVAAADWTPLYGRTVDIWPDADEPGKAAAKAIADLLVPKCPTVRMIDVTDAPSVGWDLADAVADGWDTTRIIEWGKKRIAAVVPAPAPATPPVAQKAFRRSRTPAEIEADKLLALRPVKFGSLKDVAAGTYAPKIPLFADAKNSIFYPGAHLIVGRPKIGKSWLLLQLALCVTQATTFLGMTPMRKDVGALMICAEDDQARIKSRLAALGVGLAPENCLVVTHEEFRLIATTRSKYQTFPEFLDQWLTENPAAKLVIVDTETTCRQTWVGEQTAGDDGRRITDTDYQQTRAFDAVALKHEAVIGLVNHASKRKGEIFDVHELINRSNTALAGASGSLVLADPPGVDPMNPSGKQRILGARARDMKDDMLLCVQQEIDLPMFTSLGEYAAVQQSQIETEILEAVEEFQNEDQIPGKRYSTQDIADHLGIKRQSVKRAISRMLEKPAGKYWKTYEVEVKRGRQGGIMLVKH